MSVEKQNNWIVLNNRTYINMHSIMSFNVEIDDHDIEDKCVNIMLYGKNSYNFDTEDDYTLTDINRLWDILTYDVVGLKRDRGFDL